MTLGLDLPMMLIVSIFIIPAAISLAVYIQTTSNSIAGGDSGELVAEGCTLGTAHPPGYPLYTIIVYFVTNIGKRLWGDKYTPAYLVNVTSCVFGSIASGLISLTVFQLTDDGSAQKKDNIQKPQEKKKDDESRFDISLFSRCSAAMSVSLMCSFSPLMWQYNISAEVFALHNLLVSSIVNVLTRFFFQPNSTRTIVAGAFLCGLALTNQHTSILLIIPVVACVVYTSSMLKKSKLLVMSSISFIAGFSIYITLPLLAFHYPHAGSWGNVTSLSGFIHHLLRRDYGTLRLYSGENTGSEGMPERTLSWAKDLLFYQLPHPVLVGYLLVGFVGVCLNRMDGSSQTRQNSVPTKTRRTKKEVARGKELFPFKIKRWGATERIISFALVFYLAVFHSLSNLPLSNPLLYGIHQRFWMHPNILCFILIGVGLHNSIVIVSKTSLAMASVFVVAALFLPIASYHQNIFANDQSESLHFHNYAMSILEILPYNSILFINYDQQWTSIRYIQECEGVRDDITSINLSMMSYPWWDSKQSLYPEVDFPGSHYTKGNTLPWLNGGFTFSELLDKNIESFGGNIFLGGKLNFDDTQYNEKYEETPHGLVRRIEKRTLSTGSGNASISAEHYRLKSQRAWSIVSKYLSSNLPTEEKYPPSTWEWTIRREFFDHLVSRSTYLLDMAIRDSSGSTQHRMLPSLVESAAWLELASSWDEAYSNPSPSMKKNLGLAYMHIVRNQEQGGFPYVEDIFDVSYGNTTRGDSQKPHRHNWWTKKTDNLDDSWKGWATTRWQEEWGTFLKIESSRAEPGYDQVKSIYQSVMKASSSKANSRR